MLSDESVLVRLGAHCMHCRVELRLRSDFTLACQGVADEDEGTLAIAAMERARHHLKNQAAGCIWEIHCPVGTQLPYDIATDLN